MGVAYLVYIVAWRDWMSCDKEPVTLIAVASSFEKAQELCELHKKTAFARRDSKLSWEEDKKTFYWCSSPFNIMGDYYVVQPIGVNEIDVNRAPIYA